MTPSIIQHETSILVVGYFVNYVPNKSIFALDMESLQWSKLSMGINGYNELTDKCCSSLLLNNDNVLKTNEQNKTIIKVLIFRLTCILLRDMLMSLFCFSTSINLSHKLN